VTGPRLAFDVPVTPLPSGGYSIYVTLPLHAIILPAVVRGEGLLALG